jgi:hypothetical protein
MHSLKNTAANNSLQGKSKFWIAIFILLAISAWIFAGPAWSIPFAMIAVSNWLFLRNLRANSKRPQFTRDMSIDVSDLLIVNLLGSEAYFNIPEPKNWEHIKAAKKFCIDVKGFENELKRFLLEQSIVNPKVTVIESTESAPFDEFYLGLEDGAGKTYECTWSQGRWRSLISN